MKGRKTIPWCRVHLGHYGTTSSKSQLADMKIGAVNLMVFPKQKLRSILKVPSTIETK
jgi:hypothetical protein